MNPEDLSGSHVKIGAPSHAVRNIGVLVATALLGAGIWGFYRNSAAQDSAKLAKLEGFRSAFAEKCEAAGWRGEAAPMVRETYLGSTNLQAAVEQQWNALNSGADCDSILKALRAADFPLPSPAAK
jgi:hypothetical protein